MNRQLEVHNKHNWIISICFILVTIHFICSFFAALTSFEGTKTSSLSIFSGYLSVLVGFFVFVCSLMFFKNFNKNERYIFNLGFCFLFFVVFQFLTGINSFEITISDIIGPLFSYSLFSYALREHFISRRFTFILCVCLFVVFEISIFLFKSSQLYSIFGGTLQASYFVLFLLPICFNLKKEWLIYVCIVASIISSIMSFKRGAIISVFIVTTLFILYKLLHSNFKQKLLLISLVVVAYYGVLYYIGYSGDEFSFVLKRMSDMGEDGGSGRSDIYSFFLNKISDFSLLDHLVGRGFKSTTFVNNGLTAHNDWIELYYDFGFFLFIPWCFFIVKQIISGIRDSQYRQLGVSKISLMAVYIVLSMVSHVFFFGYFYALMIILSYYNNIKYESRNSYIS